MGLEFECCAGWAGILSKFAVTVLIGHLAVCQMDVHSCQ
jgi:hypothetical protein